MNYARLSCLLYTSINESYKKLIGTAKVTFPKGTVCRSTIIGNMTLEGKDVSRITTEVMQDGVIIEKRSTQRLSLIHIFRLSFANPPSMILNISVDILLLIVYFDTNIV